MGKRKEKYYTRKNGPKYFNKRLLASIARTKRQNDALGISNTSSNNPIGVLGGTKNVNGKSSASDDLAPNECMMEQVLYNVAQTVEKQLDGELERLDALDNSDLEAIRQQRLNEMKQRATKKQEWLAIGHGEYSELDGEKEFFTVSNKSDNVVCHFYKADSPRCRIVDMHLKILAKKHVETRFVKLDAERAPFLAGRLKIRVIPTIALVKQNKTKDFIVGFTDLGNRDDFSTETLEWRIARSDVIEYAGDLTVPPEQSRAQRRLLVQAKRTVRGQADADSDSDGLGD